MKKIIKTFCAILFLSASFMACEADPVSDEVGIEDQEILGEDGHEDVLPG